MLTAIKLFISGFKTYIYIALAVAGISLFTWYSLFLYKAGWNGHVAAQAVEQGKLNKRMDKVKADSARALALARKESDLHRRKYRDTLRKLRATDQTYKDWAVSPIPDIAIDTIWLRRE